MPDYEIRPAQDPDHEQKGGYPGGPQPDGLPPVPRIFKPFVPSDAPPPGDPPTQVPPPEATTAQG
jgi:hypothetical protein